MSKLQKPFHIMAKPVCGKCNLDCSYCYYTAKCEELYPDVDDFQMPDDVLAAYTQQYLLAQPQRCEFGWQGGEPLLAGREFFNRAVELQKQFATDGQVVTNAIQTNGTLLDEQWCEFLAANNFLVGISLDGPAQWHDAFRRDHGGKPTFHRAWAGLEMLAKHDVEFNVLVTLNSANAPHAGDIYRYFVNKGIRYVQFIPILEQTADGQPTDFSCTGEQFGKFMIEVFETWAARDVGKVSERFIDNCLHQIIYSKAAMCCYAESCANAFVLEFNGDLYACDHFVFGEWLIGNINDRPLAELTTDAKVEKFSRLKTDLPAACSDCEYLRFCRGGCPKHHLPAGSDPARVNHFCSGYKMFFKRALPELHRIAKQIAAQQQQQQQQQPDRPPATAQPTDGKTPGRNEPCPCGSGRKFKSCCGRR